MEIARRQVMRAAIAVVRACRLPGIRLEGQDNAVETEAIVGGTDVVGGDGAWMAVAGQGDTDAFIDGHGDARLGSHARQAFHFRPGHDRRVPGQHQD